MNSVWFFKICLPTWLFNSPIIKKFSRKYNNITKILMSNIDHIFQFNIVHLYTDETYAHANFTV